MACLATALGKSSPGAEDPNNFLCREISWEAKPQNMGSKSSKYGKQSYKIQIIGGRRSCPVLVIACNVDSLPSVSVMGWGRKYNTNTNAIEMRKYNENTHTIVMGWLKIQHNYKYNENGMGPKIRHKYKYKSKCNGMAENTTQLQIQ